MRGFPKNPISVLAGGSNNRLVKTDGSGLLAESGITIDSNNNLSGIGTLDSGVLTVTEDVDGAATLLILTNDHEVTPVSATFKVDKLGNMVFDVLAGSIFLLPEAGGAVQINQATGALLFNSGEAVNIGTASANRPDNIWAKTDITAGGTFLAGGFSGAPSHNLLLAVRQEPTTGIKGIDTGTGLGIVILGNDIGTWVATGLSLVDNFDITLGGTGFIQSGSEGFKVGNTIILDGEIIDADEIILFLDAPGGSFIDIVAKAIIGTTTLDMAGSKFTTDIEGFITQDSGVATDTYFTQTGVGHWQWTRNSGTTAHSINQQFRRSRGNRTAFIKLNDADPIGKFLYFVGTHTGAGTTFSGSVAEQRVEAEGNHVAGSSYPTKFVWATTGEDEIVDTDKMILDKDGNLILGKGSDVGIKVDIATPTFGFADLLGDQFSKNTGASRPTLTTYNGAVEAWQFGDTDEAFLTYHIPHDYVKGSDIHLHIHWSQNATGATGGTVDFRYTAIYAKGHNQASGSVFTSSPITATFSSVDIDDGGSGLNQYQQHFTEVTISAASATAALFDRDDFEPDGVIELTFELVTSNLTGTPSTPFVHFVDIHYQTTGLIGTKSRVPDFYV